MELVFMDIVYGVCLFALILSLYYLFDELRFRFRLWQIRRATWRRIKHEIERGDGI